MAKADQDAWAGKVRKQLRELAGGTRGPLAIICSDVPARDAMIDIVNDMASEAVAGMQGRAFHVLSPEEGHTALINEPVAAIIVLDVRPT